MFIIHMHQRKKRKRAAMYHSCSFDKPIRCGGPKCRHEGCEKSALGDRCGGKTLYCSKHGGGPRCQYIDCTRSALGDRCGGKASHCVKHGGGPRCRHVGCDHSALGDRCGGKSIHCVKHGGGPRCQYNSCASSALGNTTGGKAKHCVKHGGGPRCQYTDCMNSASGNGQNAKATHCIRHGGGRRCEHADHDSQRTSLSYPPAPALHQLAGTWLCHQHFYHVVNKKCRSIRREVLLLGEVLSTLPGLLGLSHDEFHAYYIGHDFNVRSCQLIRRPDMLFKFRSFAMLLEIDEHAHAGRTEYDEMCHLDVIRRWCCDTLGLNRMFVLRINPDGKHPMFRQYHSSNKESMWKPTAHFLPKFEQVCIKHIVPVIKMAISGTEDDVDEIFEGAILGMKVSKIFF
jgi:hypothetical protein